MSDSGAGLGKEKKQVAGGALSKPCQWPHVRARRRFAATRPPLLIWIQQHRNLPTWELPKGAWSLRLHRER